MQDRYKDGMKLVMKRERGSHDWMRIRETEKKHPFWVYARMLATNKSLFVKELSFLNLDTTFTIPTLSNITSAAARGAYVSLMPVGISTLELFFSRTRGSGFCSHLFISSSTLSPSCPCPSGLKKIVLHCFVFWT